MSQEQLAERLGVSVMTIKRLETNRQSVSLARAIEITDIFGCGLNDLIEKTVLDAWQERFLEILAPCSNDERDFLYATLQAMITVYRRNCCRK